MATTYRKIVPSNKSTPRAPPIQAETMITITRATEVPTPYVPEPYVSQEQTALATSLLGEPQTPVQPLPVTQQNDLVNALLGGVSSQTGTQQNMSSPTGNQQNDLVNALLGGGVSSQTGTQQPPTQPPTQPAQPMSPEDLYQQIIASLKSQINALLSVHTYGLVEPCEPQNQMPYQQNQMPYQQPQYQQPQMPRYGRK